MKTTTVLAALILGALTGPSTHTGMPEASEPQPSTGEETADRGLVTLHEAGSPFIAFNIWVRAGSQNDPEGKEGLAALTAGLLANGATTRHSYEEILEALYPMATGYGSSTDKEMTVFRGVVHEDNLEEYYGLFRAAILEPAFSPEDFERVKARTLNFLERGRRYGRDEELTKELLFAEAYRGTPYEHPEEGYVESVRSITLDDVKAFYRKFYVANNIVVGVGGGFEEGFAQQVRADFDELPEGTVEHPAPPRARQPEGIEVLLVEKDVDASPISMGHPIDVLRGDEDFWPLMLFNSWFGEHRNSFSNLYQVIREARGMNYGDYSYIEAYPLGYTTQVPPTNVARRSQLFEIWIRPISLTEPGNLHDRTLFATRAALRELRKKVEEGMTREEFDATRQFLHNYTVNWGATVSRRLAYAVDDAFYGLEGEGYLRSIRPELADLTLEEVNETIPEHLGYRDLFMVIITSDAEGMKEKLVSGEPTPISYPGDKPTDLLAEDEEIATYPLRVEEEKIRIIPIGEVFESGG